VAVSSALLSPGSSRESSISVCSRASISAALLEREMVAAKEAAAALERK
jgi:hypothetical protein